MALSDLFGRGEAHLVNNIDLAWMDCDPPGATHLGTLAAFAPHPIKLAEEENRVDRLDTGGGSGEQAHHAGQSKDIEQLAVVAAYLPGTEGRCHIESPAPAAKCDYSRAERDLSRVQNPQRC